MALLLAGCSGPRTPAPPPITHLSGLTIHFLNVGYGSAAILQWEGRAALVDGGPASATPVVLTALKRYHVSRLDWVIATCDRAEHVGGLAAVLRAVPTAHFLDPGFDAGTPEQKDVLRAIQERRVDYREAHEDRTEDLGQGLALYTFAPPDPLLEGSGADDKNNSLVGRLMYGKVRVLFTGDMGQPERVTLFSQLPNQYTLDKAMRADVLVCSDHGSREGTDAELLGLVKPTSALLSTGKATPPDATVLAALKSAAIPFHRTDKDGGVTLTTDGTTVRFSHG